jgi:WD40 repeat protein
MTSVITRNLSFNGIDGVDQEVWPMTPAAATDFLPKSKAKIFISYSRKDKAFAARLEAALKRRGFEPLIDRTEIYAFEDWWKRIKALIGTADTVVFILSPDAVTSDVARREVEYAAALNKRFAPIICRRVDDALVPAELRQLNFVYFDDLERFETSADQLADGLSTDIGWIRGHTEYGEAARRWVHAGKPTGLLPRSPALEEAEVWISHRPEGAPQPTLETQTFILEGRRNATRRRNVLTGSLAVGLLVAIVLAAIALTQRNTARSEAQIALSRQLAAQARNNLDQNYDLALLLAVQAKKLSSGAEVLGSLFDAVRYSPHLERFLHQDEGVEAFDLSPDGRLLASLGSRGGLQIWDIGSQNPTSAVLKSASPNIESGVKDVAFTSDGTVVGVAIGQTISLWEISTKRELPVHFTAASGIVLSLSFSPDNMTIAAASADGALYLWNYKTGLQTGRFKAAGVTAARSLAFSPDGRLLAIGGDGQEQESSSLMIWDVVSQKPLGQPLVGHKNGVYKLAFSHDGTTLASGSYDETAILWDVQSHRPIGQPLAGQSGTVFALAFSPDDQILATGGYDQKVRMWSVKNQELIDELVGHNERVFGISFGKDKLLSGDANGNIIVWNTNDNVIVKTISTQEPSADTARQIAYSPKLDELATAAGSNTVLLWDLRNGQANPTPLRGHKSSVLGVCFSADGKILASTSADGTVILWNVAERHAIGNPLVGHREQVLSAAFSPDGKILATGDMGGKIILWDVSTHEAIGSPIRLNTGEGKPTGWINTIAFSPNGRLLAAGTNSGKIFLLDARTRRLTREPILAHNGQVTKIVFSPVANLLASSGSDASVVFWDLDRNQPDGRPVRIENSDAAVYDIIFSPNGKFFATSTLDENVTLWDAEARQKIGRSFSQIGSTITYSIDGRRIATAGGRRVYFIPFVNYSPDGSTTAKDDGSETPSDAGDLLSEPIVGLSLINVDPNSWAALACHMANRELSTAEWTQFLRNVPYQSVCK